MSRMKVQINDRNGANAYLLSRYVRVAEKLEEELQCSGLCDSHPNYVFSPRLNPSD